MDNIYTERLFDTIKCYLFDVAVMFYINYLSNLEENLVIYCQSQNIYNALYSEEDVSEQKIKFNLKPLTKVK